MSSRSSVSARPISGAGGFLVHGSCAPKRCILFLVIRPSDSVFRWTRFPGSKLPNIHATTNQTRSPSTLRFRSDRLPIVRSTSESDCRKTIGNFSAEVQFVPIHPAGPAGFFQTGLQAEPRRGAALDRPDRDGGRTARWKTQCFHAADR